VKTDLYHSIANYFQSIPSQDELTVGVEHEFFLFKNGLPVMHKESQQFLNAISDFVPRYVTDENIGSYIESVTDKESNTIKYDHHPFLLEIEIAYSGDLSVIEQRLQHCFHAVYSAAATLRFEISFDPILAISTSDERTKSDLKFRKKLIHYRSKLFELRNEPIDDALTNYAAGIAATQVHIGGVPFEKYDEVFPALYQKEKATLNAVKNSIKSRFSPSTIFEKREQLYKAAFKNYPLAGFPTFEWTVENWIEALQNTPLFGTEEEYFTAKTFNDFPELATSMPTEEFLFRVRDLQWIKPHRQGTVEFRACPALADVESIIKLCTLRLNTVKNILKNEPVRTA
jgi:hypothetical protein